MRNNTTVRTRRPWLHGQWTETRSNEFPWPGYTIDTSTVLDLLRIAREDDPRAFVTTSVDMGDDTPVPDAEIDDLPLLFEAGADPRLVTGFADESRRRAGGHHTTHDVGGPPNG